MDTEDNFDYTTDSSLNIDNKTEDEKNDFYTKLNLLTSEQGITNKTEIYEKIVTDKQIDTNRFQYFELIEDIFIQSKDNVHYLKNVFKKQARYPSLNTSETTIFGSNKIRPSKTCLPPDYRTIILNEYNEYENLTETIHNYRDIINQGNDIRDVYFTKNRIPRCILYNFFKRKWDQYPIVLEYCFLPFFELVNCIRKGWLNGINLLEHPLFKGLDFNYSSIYGLNTVAVMNVLEHKDDITIRNKNHSIFLSLLIRLVCANFFIRRYKLKVLEKKQETKTRYHPLILNLYLFIDTHLDLIRYISFHEEYNDYILSNRNHNKEDYIIDAFNHFYPSDDKYIFSGDFPNISNCIDKGSIWSDTTFTKGLGLLSAFIHLVVSKTQNQKCLQRNLIGIVHKYFLLHPILIDLFRLIIQISLLGNYIHANDHPDVIERMDIYYTFDIKNTTDQWFYEWIKGHQNFLDFALKEFYISSAESNWAFVKVLYEDPIWISINDNIKKATDCARSVLSRRSIVNIFETPPQSYKSTEEEKIAYLKVMQERTIKLFNDIEIELVNNHETALKFLLKANKKNFLDVIYTQCEKILEETIPNKFLTHSIESSNILSECEIDNIKYFAELSVIRSDNRLDTRWFNVFLLNEDNIYLFRKIYCLYESKLASTADVYLIIQDIQKRSNKDFHILRCFIEHIAFIKTLKIFPLTPRIGENQANALRRKYKIMPWNELPSETYEIYFCSFCGRLNTSHINCYNRNVTSAFSLGLQNCLYNWNDGKLYCKKVASTPTIKKIKNTGVLDMKEIENEGLAAVIRRYNNLNKCNQTSLSRLDILGKLLLLNKKYWCLCEICGVLTPFDSLAFGENGLTCPLHNKTSPLIIPTKLDLFNDKYDDYINKIKEQNQLKIDQKKITTNTFVETPKIVNEQPNTPPELNDNDLKLINFFEGFDETLKQDYMPKELLQKSQQISASTTAKIKSITNEYKENKVLLTKLDPFTKKKKSHKKVKRSSPSSIYTQTEFKSSKTQCSYCKSWHHDNFKVRVLNGTKYGHILLCPKHYANASLLLSHSKVSNTENVFSCITNQQFYTTLNKNKYQK